MAFTIGNAIELPPIIESQNNNYSELNLELMIIQQLILLYI